MVGNQALAIHVTLPLPQNGAHRQQCGCRDRGGAVLIWSNLVRVAEENLSKMGERDELIFSAQLSETAERYDEMRDTMKQVVDMAAGNLTEEERNLLGKFPLPTWHRPALPPHGIWRRSDHRSKTTQTSLNLLLYPAGASFKHCVSSRRTTVGIIPCTVHGGKLSRSAPRADLPVRRRRA